MGGFDDRSLPCAQRLPSSSILEHFSALSDPRQRWRVLYPLPEILLLVLCATLSGMEDFVEMRLWGEQRLDFLRRFLPYEAPGPCRPTTTLQRRDQPLGRGTVQDLFCPAGSRRCAIARPISIAIDGKTSRRNACALQGSRAAASGLGLGGPVSRLVLGQQAVDDKSNEIIAIPLLLERLQLTGALVTIDAMGTQTDIADKIVGRGGDYLLALKANRPLLHRDGGGVLRRSASRYAGAQAQYHDGDHGRIEERRHVVCHKVDWLFSDRRYADEPRFPHLAMIGMVETRVERNGTVAQERRYYLSSTRLDAKTFAATVRAHWGIENRLHWVLDVVFHDDLARLRSRNGAAKHGRGQTHGHEPRAKSKRQAQPQGPAKTRQPQSQLPRNSDPSDRPVKPEAIPLAPESRACD